MAICPSLKFFLIAESNFNTFGFLLVEVRLFEYQYHGSEM